MFMYRAIEWRLICENLSSSLGDYWGGDTPPPPPTECVTRQRRAQRARGVTRAPLGYFYNTPHCALGGAISIPPLISETTGPILKIQAALESPGKLSRGKILPRGHQWHHRSGQSKNVRLFGLGDIGEQNFDIKLKQSQRIGMDSVADIRKYHFLCFVTII